MVTVSSVALVRSPDNEDVELAISTLRNLSVALITSAPMSKQYLAKRVGPTQESTSRFFKPLPSLHTGKEDSEDQRLHSSEPLHRH